MPYVSPRAAGKPHNATESEDRPFLPEVAVDGYRGFYPLHCQYAQQPTAAFKAFSVVEGLKGIKVELMGIVCSGRGITTVISPKDLLGLLNHADNVSVKVLRLVWEGDDDNGTTFASWRQDRKTGAFAIVMGSNGDVVVKQGGFRDHVPFGVNWRPAHEAYGNMHPGRWAAPQAGDPRTTEVYGKKWTTGAWA